MMEHNKNYLRNLLKNGFINTIYAKNSPRKQFYVVEFEERSRHAIMRSRERLSDTFTQVDSKPFRNNNPSASSQRLVRQLPR